MPEHGRSGIFRSLEEIVLCVLLVWHYNAQYDIQYNAGECSAEYGQCGIDDADECGINVEVLAYARTYSCEHLVGGFIKFLFHICKFL